MFGDANVREARLSQNRPFKNGWDIQIQFTDPRSVPAARTFAKEEKYFDSTQKIGYERRQIQFTDPDCKQPN